MKLRVQAIRALRWNYRWKGVWRNLTRRRCHRCGGLGYEPGLEHLHAKCSSCNGKPRRGFWRVLAEPQSVISEQEAIAEGAMG